mgnify:CR=1 FL=1
MPLHMTKVAFKAASLAEIHGWFADRGSETRLTTRYLPKRHAELVGGSLYWIITGEIRCRQRIKNLRDGPQVIVEHHMRNRWLVDDAPFHLIVGRDIG